jgi:hypothetical protein
MRGDAPPNNPPIPPVQPNNSFLALISGFLRSLIFVYSRYILDFQVPLKLSKEWVRYLVRLSGELQKGGRGDRLERPSREDLLAIRPWSESTLVRRGSADLASRRAGSVRYRKDPEDSRDIARRYVHLLKGDQ